jgi:hypothetical protein
MPQLKNAVKVGNEAIVYEGAAYVKTGADAEPGDIVRIECYDLEHYPLGAFYFVWGYDGHTCITDEDEDDYSRVSGDPDFTVFRRVAEPGANPLITVQLIEQKRAELAEFERALAEELANKRPTVGSYALVTDDGSGNFGKGTVVRVIHEDGSSTPFKPVPALLSDDTDAHAWYKSSEIERLKPAEAKAALLAQVESLFSGDGV